MADEIHAEVAGLQISNSTFSASPPGSLIQATNCVMPQKGVIEPRRGQDRYGTMPDPTQVPFQLTAFQGALIANYATSKTDTSYGLGLVDDPTVGFAGGPYNPVDCDGTSESYARMHFGFAGSYLNFCTTTGPKVLETVGDVPRDAGLFRMPDPLLTMVSTSVATPPLDWLEYGSSVAYRTVSRTPTSDGTSLLSPPSGRAIIRNRIYAPVGAMTRSGGTTVTVVVPGVGLGGIGLAIGDTFDLTPGEANFAAGTYTVASVSGSPTNTITYADAGANVSNTVAQDLDTGPRAVAISANLSASVGTTTPVRIYRSLATVSTEPSDEMYLVAEVFPDNTDISNGFLPYIDTTPESVISDPLYTNPQTGEGAKQANDRPPVYRDVTAFGSRLWYANTTGLQTLSVQLLGVGSPDGIQAGDTITITIDGTPYTATAGTDFDIFSDGTPSQNILNTTQDMIASFNFVFSPGQSDERVRLYYNSAEDEAPGKFIIQRTDIGTAVNFDVSRVESWVPAIVSGTGVDSIAERIPNGLAYSKLSQPEAVPPVNYTAVGSKNFPIARIIGLQQALLVFKQGDGIYSVTGSYPFQVQQISVANIIAPDACCLFADAAWVYTDQGILRVSDSGGATVVSRPIETELNALRAVMPDETANWSFAVPYETERRVMFFVPFDTNETTGLPVMKAWCYNNATNAWTGPVYADVFSGVVEPTANLLALGTWDEEWFTSRVTLERKDIDFTDYADEAFALTISAVDGNTLTPTSLADIEVGDGVLQTISGIDYRARITAVGATTIEVDETAPWATGAATLYKGYDVELQFQPSGNPSARKTLTRLAWLFKPQWFETATGLTTLLTDQVQDELEVDTVSLGFGSNITASGAGFGMTPFGDPTPMVRDVNPLKAEWTNAAQFFVGFKLREAWMKLKVQGFSALVETASAPSGRR